MKKRLWTMVTLTLVTLVTVVTGQQKAKPDLDVQLKAASQKELVDGDPKGAIALYQKIVDNAEANHVAAAKALIEMGRLYGRLNNPDAEKKAYERILKDYPDEKDAVALARTRLGGNTTTAATWRTVWTPTITGFGAPTFGTISASGRFFSYTDIFTRDIFIRDLVTNADRNFTNRLQDSKEYPYESVLSSDGKRIASNWKKTPGDYYKIRVANLTGDPNTRTVYDTEDHPDVYDVFLQDWSRDGKTLALLVLNKGDETAQIALVSVSDRTVQILQTVNWGGGFRAVQHMRFSPDGKYLGYDRPQDPNQSGARGRGAAGTRKRNVVLVAVDGSKNEIPAVVNDSNDTMVGWSPDGNFLLFASDRGGSNDLWAVAFNAGRVDDPPRRLRTNIGSPITPLGLSDSGALYYHTTQTGLRVPNVQLGTLDFNTGRYSAVSVTDQNYRATGVGERWSPDGKKFVVGYLLKDRDNKDATALAVHSDTGGLLALLQLRDLTEVQLKRWTPDGRSLLVQARDTEKRLGIYRVDSQTGETSAIGSETEFIESIAWLPGGASFLARMGSQVGFSRASSPVASADGSGIYRFNVEAGDRTPIVLDTNSFTVDSSVVSPNGRTLYYRKTIPAKEGSEKSVAVIARDLGTETERELTRQSLIEGIHLSPDGQYIAAETKGPGASRALLLIPTAGGPARELHTPLPTVALSGWLPDSRRLLVGHGHPTMEEELWLVPLSGEPKKVVGDSSIPIKGPISVSPDGRHFLNANDSSVAPSTSEVVVLENFLPKPGSVKK